jgi:two-component system sporulation sensor kinase A
LLLGAAAILIVHHEKVLLFPLIFIVLIYGAFHWSLMAFFLRAGFWVMLVSIVMLFAQFNGQISLRDLYSLPVFIFILFLVFKLDRKRTGAEKALHVSEDHYRRLVELAFESVIIVVEERFVFANSQAVRLFRANQPEDMIGKTINTFLHPSSVADIKLWVQQAMNGSGEMPLLEGQLTRADNSVLDIEAVGLVIQYQGQPAMQFVIRDISQRKQAVQEVIRTARMVTLGKLTTAMVHELNNPLQIIQGYLDMVLDFPLPPEEKGIYLEIVRQQVGHLHFVTHRTLNYARSEKNVQQLVCPVDLVEHVLAFVHKHLQQRGIQIVKDFQAVSPVMVVPDVLIQVFLNLVLNAAESIEDGGTVQIMISMDDECVAVSFTTYGVVISADVMPNIFEPFFTTKPGGSGLGLWISRSLVEWYGGQLVAKNLIDGDGVVFTVMLPTAFMDE